MPDPLLTELLEPPPDELLEPELLLLLELLDEPPPVEVVSDSVDVWPPLAAPSVLLADPWVLLTEPWPPLLAGAAGLLPLGWHLPSLAVAHTAEP